MKLSKKNWLHLGIILVGVIFISIPVFHSNVWFDEAYSVGMASHNFGEIWTIGGSDVHPVLYYWVLHIVNIVFGNNIITYRLLSVIFVAIMGILGFTHIRKDFGDNVGIIFSFLVFFLPTNLVYAGEIRMYTLAMLMVTLMSIYAYRIFKNKDEKNIKNWVLFSIFSLASAYTHYYALGAAGIINLFLFVYFVYQSIKEKKIVWNLKAFVIQAVPQIILYIPWLVSLLTQVKQVSNGFWIEWKLPDSLIEFFNFQFTGNLGGDYYVPKSIASLFGIAFCIYMIYLQFEKKKDGEGRPELIAASVWFLLVIAVRVASLIMGRPIIYARYMLCVLGLLIFIFSYSMAKRSREYLIIIALMITTLLSIHVQGKLLSINYDQTNNEPVKYLEENIKENDIIVHKNDINSFIMDVYFPDNKAYFWNKEKWGNVDKAYKAFGYNFTTEEELDNLKDFEGTLWIIDSNPEFVNDVKNELENMGIENLQISETKTFNVKYHNINYTITAISKQE